MLCAMAYANNLSKKCIRFLTLWVCLILTGNLIAQNYFDKHINYPHAYLEEAAHSILPTLNH